MTGKESTISLRQIMNHIKSGGSYAEHVENVRFPYDHKVLYLTRGGYIGWSHYGSSACRVNLHDLDWTVRHIFEMTPAEFLKTYTALAAGD